MALTPLRGTRGLWVKTAAEQLEEDNECNTHLTRFVLCDEQEHYATQHTYTHIHTRTVGFLAVSLGEYKKVVCRSQ